MLAFNRIKRLGGLCLALCLSACSTVTPPMNQPIREAQTTPTDKTGAADLSPKAWRKGNVLLILTFSGGGTRAAALSYGVLKGLRDTPISPLNATVQDVPRNLLAEVDIISAVSGGSFTAAYYGLFGEQIFADYEDKFLRHPVQSEMIHRWLLLPRNWGKLGSTLFNRTDLAAEYYDNQLFHNKTFSQMKADKPLIIINTTDISAGSSFAFTPENMRWICSDLGGYPVSRAVAASSAVPGVFSPITLKNFSGCRLPQTIQSHPPKPGQQLSRQDNEAFIVHQYRDKKRYPYLHLVDGGVTDNLGIRSVLYTVALQGDDFPALLKHYGLEHINTVAVIVVNSSTDIPPQIAQAAEEPNLERTVGAVTTIQSKRYNSDTLDLLNQKMTQWAAQMRRHQCGEEAKSSCQSMPFYSIELNLKQLPDALAEETSLYPTSLELTQEQVDKLIDAGQYLLKKNPTYQKFIQQLK